MIRNMHGNVGYEEYYVRFVTERFLARLETTPYLDKFVIKGGFLLETIYDIQQRTTQDLDTLIRNMSNDKEELLLILEEISAVDLNDNVVMEVLSVDSIQEQKKYAGVRAKFVLKFLGENASYNFTLDIGVGDAITPEPKLRKIPLLFNDKKQENKAITVYAYPIETILAEKIETILTLSIRNSRMKDFYDIYLILSDPNLPPIEDCFLAFENTWKFRSGFPIEESLFEDWFFVIDLIQQNKTIQETYWPNYCTKRAYAKDIDLNEILLLLRNYMEELQQQFIKKTRTNGE